MFLSIQQKFILDTLKKLNCVRQRQLHALVRGRFQQDGFEVTQARMDAMLRQLRAGTADVRLDDGLVWLSNAQPDARRLEAIDVMLELTGRKPQEFNSGPSLWPRWTPPPPNCWSGAQRSALSGSRTAASLPKGWPCRPSTFSPPVSRTEHIAFMALTGRKKYIFGGKQYA